MAKAMKTMKTLAHMKNSSKGSIHHLEIHPAKNSSGGQGFITTIHRNRPAGQEAAMQKGGPYMPPPEPDETVHENGPDMLKHVGNAYGVPQPSDGDGDEQPPEPAE